MDLTTFTVNCVWVSVCTYSVCFPPSGLVFEWGSNPSSPPYPCPHSMGHSPFPPRTLPCGPGGAGARSPEDRGSTGSQKHLSEPYFVHCVPSGTALNQPAPVCVSVRLCVQARVCVYAIYSLNWAPWLHPWVWVWVPTHKLPHHTVDVTSHPPGSLTQLPVPIVAPFSQSSTLLHKKRCVSRALWQSCMFAWTGDP